MCPSFDLVKLKYCKNEEKISTQKHQIIVGFTCISVQNVVLLNKLYNGGLI